MPDTKISAMDPAGALTGAELVPAVQSGANVRTNVADIAAYANNLISLSSLGASANGITLIGHTFAQMRTDLGLVIGTNVQAYDADTAKTDVVQSWSAAQTFSGATEFTGLTTQSGVQPIRRVRETDAPTNEQYWAEYASGGDLFLTAVNDALSNETIWLQVARSGIAISSISLAVRPTFNGNTALDTGNGAQLAAANTFTADQTFLGGVGAVKVGDGTQVNSLVLDSIGSGSGDGGFVHFKHGGVTVFAIGNYSSIIGSAFDARPILYGDDWGVYTGGSYRALLHTGNGAQLGAANTFTNPIQTISAAVPAWTLNDTGGGTDGKRWWMVSSGGTLYFQAVNDAVSGSSNWLTVTRSGTTPTGITFGAPIIAGGPIRLSSYTVAGLPAGSTGDTAYASNGRKNGEGGGAGTGVLVFKDASAWRACDTGATVAA